MKQFLVKGTHLTIGMHMIKEYTAPSTIAAREMFVKDFGTDFFLRVTQKKEPSK